MEPTSGRILHHGIPVLKHFRVFQYVDIQAKKLQDVIRFARNVCASDLLLLFVHNAQVETIFLVHETVCFANDLSHQASETCHDIVVPEHQLLFSEQADVGADFDGSSRMLTDRSLD